ncbi:hypothetical protein BDR05DRAFT_1002943 [Suillus weaverae]|nr:hypothetical protein BDR05DRAFT_1002943 [Suillus weaverae]
MPKVPLPPHSPMSGYYMKTNVSKDVPSTPPSNPRVLPTTAIKAATPIKQPKFHKGRIPSLSVSSDEEENARSQQTAATTVSLSTPSLAIPKAQSKPKVTEEPKTTTKAKPIRRNLMRNPSMFGPELPCPQATPSPPSRIPLSSPIGSPIAVSLATVSPSTPATPLLNTQMRPRTLRRAACRIEFGSLRAASPVLPGENGTVALGSAFQLA